MSQAPTSAQRGPPSGDGIMEVVGGERLYILPVFVQKPEGSLSLEEEGPGVAPSVPEILFLPVCL